jgi:hypothetical protein
MRISYSNIFKIAWQITAKNRILWFFGIFASFLSLESVYEVIFSQIQQTGNYSDLSQKIANFYADQIAFINEQMYFLSLLSKDHSVYLLFILAIALLTLFLWFVFTSQIYLIKSAAQIYKNKKSNRAELFTQSSSKFWPVFGINLLAKLILYAGFIALSIPLLYLILNQEISATNLATTVFLILYTLIAIVISFLTAYATNFIILKDQDLLTAIKNAWHLFTHNIALSLEIATILFLLKILSLIIMFFISCLILIPLLFIIIYFLFYSALVANILALTAIILVFIALYLLASAIFTVFYLSSWTITFIKLTEETFFSQLLKLVYNIPNLFKQVAKQYNIKIDKKEIKNQARKLADQTEKEALVMAKDLSVKYEKFKPVAEKQGKLLAKKIEKIYFKLKPKVTKEINKFIYKKVSQVKNKKPKSIKTRAKTGRRKKANK